MPNILIWTLALTALLVRLPALLGHQALLPAVAPAGPLVLWMQPWLDSLQGGWGWGGLAVLGAAADALSAVLLASLVDRRRLADRLLSPRRGPEGWASPGFWAGLAWAAHPVAGLLAGSAGAWQSVALFGLLSAAWNLEYSAHPNAERRAAWGFAVAISAALWPLLLLPVGAAGLLSRRARTRFYVQALFFPLLLCLPWLLLNDPRVVKAAWLGPPSALGFQGLVASLWSASSAPLALAQPLLRFWQGAALLGLLAYGLFSFWKPVTLLPGLALGAWTWVLLAPRLQGPLLLAPLALTLLMPGRLALRLSAAALIMLALQDRLPGLRSLQLGQGDPAGVWRGTHLFWAAVTLAWLFWVAMEWTRLWGYARRPQRFDPYQ